MHVVVVGNFDKFEPTWQQFNSIKKLLNYIKQQITDIVIEYHSDYAKTSCPGRFFFTKSQLNYEI
jgi:hypothetical protein